MSKQFSDLCVLTPENEGFIRTKIYHDLASMSRALELLLQAEQPFRMRLVVVMESASHYHLILFRSFKNAGYEVIVVNPIQSGASKNINVRKVKNNKVDAHKIALLYRLKALRPFQVPANSLQGLRLLCRSRLWKEKSRFAFLCRGGCLHAGPGAVHDPAESEAQRAFDREGQQK